MHRLLQMLMKLADGGAKAHAKFGHKPRLLGQAAGKLQHVANRANDLCIRMFVEKAPASGPGIWPACVCGLSLRQESEMKGDLRIAGVELCRFTQAAQSLLWGA